MKGNNMDLHLKFDNAMAHAVGRQNGLTQREFHQALSSYHRHKKALMQKYESNRLGFINLPLDTETACKISSFAESWRAKVDDFIVIGIGGSCLGNIALHNALCDPNHNLLSRKERNKTSRIHFLDNVDPAKTLSILKIINPHRCMVNVITKSGSTVETLANFLVVADFLKRRLGNAYASRIVVTTDPEKGFLRTLATEYGFHSFPIPPNVGGRFSVLSPVGLLSAAFSGINIHALLTGARRMREHLLKADSGTHDPAFQFAALNYNLDRRKGKHILVMMPYSERLKELAFWFRQLWAESLGKKYSLDGRVVETGQTPVAALGTIDQHSQLQLYMEGPRDKVICFVEVAQPQRDVKLPKIFAGDDVDYLRGRSLGEILRAEKLSTERALTTNGRPNFTVLIPSVTAEHMGALIFFLEMGLAYAGELYNVDAYNEPGVKLGKKIAYGLLGRKGYERYARVSARQKQPKFSTAQN